MLIYAHENHQLDCKLLFASRPHKRPQPHSRFLLNANWQAVRVTWVVIKGKDQLGRKPDYACSSERLTPTKIWKSVTENFKYLSLQNVKSSYLNKVI